MEAKWVSADCSKSCIEKCNFFHFSLYIITFYPNQINNFDLTKRLFLTLSEKIILDSVREDYS